MFNHGHHHSDLLLAIEQAGSVPCESVPDIYFPEDIPDREVREKAIQTAKALCADCPVFDLCRDYAVTTGQEFGIWGGQLFSPTPVGNKHADQ